MAKTKKKDANRDGKGSGNRKRKKALRGRKRAYQKLPSYALWDQVEIRLRAGEACLSIAKWWKSQGKVKHLHPKTLAKYLARYRKHEIPDEEKVAEGPLDERYRSELVKKYAGQIKLYDGVSTLINVQWERLSTVREREETIGFVIEVGDKIIASLQGLYKDLSELMFRTGVLPEVPQELHHTFKRGGNGDGEERVSREEAQSDRRVAEAALAVMRLASKAAKEQVKQLTAPNRETSSGRSKTDK